MQNNEILEIKETLTKIYDKVVSVERFLSENLYSTKSSHQDNLKDYLLRKFNDVRGKGQEFLFLIVKDLYYLEKSTSKNLESRLNIPRSTLAGYLEKLQIKNLIEFDVTNLRTPGRPGKVYKLKDECRILVNRMEVESLAEDKNYILNTNKQAYNQFVATALDIQQLSKELHNLRNEFLSPQEIRALAKNIKYYEKELLLANLNQIELLLEKVREMKRKHIS